MQALPEEIDILYKVQQADLDIKRLGRELDELPQRQVILKARQKRDAISKKRTQVAALRKDAAKKLTRINDEDASLEKKEKGAQAAIEAAGNDYRNAEARTKELNGIFKRRNELAESRSAAEAELAKIKALDEQVAQAMEELDATEAQATESFKSEGTALMQQTAQAKAIKDALLSQLSPEVAKFFNRTAALFDTVSIAKLEGNSCSVCRAKIEPGHLLDLKQNAPLANCPSCKRILIIEAEA